jgi:fluoroacetyl-CoA thioesterase
VCEARRRLDAERAPDDRPRGFSLGRRGAAEDADDAERPSQHPASLEGAVDVRPGTTAEISRPVTADRTADAMGNAGVMVLATPFLIGLLEDAAGSVIRPHLPAGAGTVGTMIEFRHLAPTPVGMTVRARATLLETDGRRFLFSIEAWDEKDKIAEGRHERVVIPSLERFLERARAKARP